MARTDTRWRRWAFVVAPVVAVAMVPLACGGAGGGSAPAASTTTTTSTTPTTTPRETTFETGFENETLEPLTGATRARVIRGAARTGSFGLDVEARGSDAYGRWDAPVNGAGGAYWSFRAWVRVVSWSRAESVDLFTVRNLETKNNFDLFVDAPEREFRWDLYRGNAAASPGVVTLGRWHLVEARGSFATDTYVADVRIDGEIQPSISSPGQPPTAVKDFVLGPGGTTKTNRVQFDDVRVEVAPVPLELFGPPVGQP